MVDTLWRLGCPAEGHVSLRKRVDLNKFYCFSCLELYDYAIDKKTGKEVKNIREIN